MKREYRIRGMDCAEEVSALRKALRPVKGILDLQFDVLNARLSVEYDPAQCGPEAIEAAVLTTGMRAGPWQPAARGEESFWQRQGRAVAAGSSAAFLAAGLVRHWIAHGSLWHALAAGGAAGHAVPADSAALYGAAIVAGGWFVVPKAWAAIRSLRPDMNLLMAVAVGGAVGLGDWFEAATVAFLFAVAQLLEHWSVGRARRAISALLDLSPQTARCLGPDGAAEERPVERVAVGTPVLVRPGERIPLDGRVAQGRSAVNQSSITGESLPAEKTPGDEVYAGTINGDGVLTIVTGKTADDTMLARIIHMVEEAHARRAPTQQWVESFARHYTPAMMALALAIAVGPPLVLGAGWLAWLYRALVILVIACPCALVISTPVSIVSGLTAAARNGVLIKGGAFLEAAGRLRALALDKTGTLTHGRPEVQQVVPFSGHTVREVLQRASALEAHSEHPLAEAIRRRASAEGLATSPASDFQAIKGKGAEATMDGRRFWIGSHRLMDEKGAETTETHAKAEELEDAGHSVVALGNDKHVCGLISVGDAVRPNARAAIDALRGAGVERIVMLTGDNDGTARAVAAQTGVDAYRAELLPEDKVEAIGTLVREFDCVAMVGDGVNDAPAMAAATFGIAMGAMGSDAAIETADMALMADDLGKLPWLIAHSRRTLDVIRQNIALALGMKALFVALTLAGYASLWMAIAADMGASLLVIFNGLRMLRR